MFGNIAENMREKKHDENHIAILGGGITGLVAAYYLSKKNKVVLFESKSTLGGLASGFKENEWDWFLEYAYHHVFTSDKEILTFANEIKYNLMDFYTPETASLFLHNNNIGIYPSDNPIDYLRTPIVPLFDRLRSASVLAGLKLSPFIPLYNRVTVGQFLKKTMGSNAWFGLWEGLLRKKFGKYAGNILAAFFWARIHKRTRGLGYPHGGFQTFVNHVSRLIVQNGGEIHIETPIQRIKKDKNVFVLSSKDKKVNFSLILSTVPTPILVRISQETLPETYIKRLSRLRYLSALSLISLSKQKLLPKTYWLNVGVGDIPLMGIIQHTNMVRSEHYNNNEIVYIPYYLEGNDPKLTMSKEEVAEFVSPHLKKINPQFNIASTKLYLFKEAYAQPIFDRLFIDNIPTLRTPVDNFYISNLDMTYPYDRGTNYAVKLGKEAAEEILKDL